MADITNEVLQIGSHFFRQAEVRQTDSAAVIALHKRVFTSDVDEHWLTWKYGASIGQGQGLAFGIWHNDELIAFCGGLPRTLWQHGRCRRGLQIGDVMVHPTWRGILTRRGPFYHVSRQFYDRQLGSGPAHDFEFGFGFPNARHLRLAVALGLLRDSGEMESLHWSGMPAPAPLPWGWHWKELGASEACNERVIEPAWQEMRAASTGLTTGERDAAYLRWRYADRPPAASSGCDAAPRYRFFRLKRLWSRQGAGIAVMDLRSDSAHWLDWIGPISLMALACRGCRLQAAQNNNSELSAWASQAVAEQLAGTGITQREVCAKIGIPNRSDLEPEQISGLRWWLMGGDTDFL